MINIDDPSFFIPEASVMNAASFDIRQVLSFWIAHIVQQISVSAQYGRRECHIFGVPMNISHSIINTLRDKKYIAYGSGINHLVNITIDWS
jgi:hypothetical protein